MSLPVSAQRICMRIGTLVLLLMLFGWGLESKVTLFHEWQVHHVSPNPLAKLLTEAERCTYQTRARDASAGRHCPLSPIAVPAGDGGSTQDGAGSCLVVAHETSPESPFSGRSYIRPPPEPETSLNGRPETA